MSSLAQEESRSISENITWGQRKRCSDGKVTVAYSHFLGYEKGPDDDHPLVIVEEEAKVIRRIYHELLLGKTPLTIAKGLTADGIKTPGKKDVWKDSTVLSILSNEKYKGSALLQKSYTADFLTKKLKPNRGEVPQYYIENSHEAIIDPEEWELTQKELERRKTLGRRYSGNGVFASRIICGDCGAFLGLKTWNSTTKYRRRIWQCNNKFKGGFKCTTPHLCEEDIKQRFIKAFNSIFKLRESVLKDCRAVMELLTDTTENDEKTAGLLREMDVSGMLAKKCIEDNACGALDSTAFEKQYAEINSRYAELRAALEAEQAAITEKRKKASDMQLFIRALEKRTEPIAEFDEMLWLAVIDHAVLSPDGTLVFKLRGGKEIEG